MGEISPSELNEQDGGDKSSLEANGGNLTSQEASGLSPPGKKGLLMTVVLAGKREAGKSTLINNILRLSKDKEAKTATSTEPTTTEVTVYSKKVDDTELKVVDVPGFRVQSEGERQDIMAQIIVKTNKEADILLYCASMNIGCQIDDIDIEIIRSLRMVFGKDLFQHCILVNTFANCIPEAEIKDRAEGFADNFLVALKKASIPNIEVRAIQPEQDEGYKIYQLASRKTTQFFQTGDQLFFMKWSRRLMMICIHLTQ